VKGPGNVPPQRPLLLEGEQAGLEPGRNKALRYCHKPRRYPFGRAQLKKSHFPVVISITYPKHTLRERRPKYK
jgi:hypothetical protein